MAQFPTITAFSARSVTLRATTGEFHTFDPRDGWPHDLLPEDHPDFEAILAVRQWLKANNIQPRDLLTNPALRQRYVNATWTERQVAG